MVRLRSSLASVITETVIIVHLLLLPALYFGMGYVIRTSHENLFVQNARSFARVLAEEFEVSVALDSGRRTQDLLDLAVTHGDALYAELDDRGRVMRSALGSPDIHAARRTDLGFSHSDDVYFIVLPVARPGHNAELRLGFDERATNERITLALHRMLVMLGLYLAVAVALAVYFSRRLSKPILRLKEASRTIASGRYDAQLSIETKVRELYELGADLEDMRRELVGVNDRLQGQILEKEASEKRGRELQKQLRHRQRLETVGTLAGGIAHEFNNVLVPILLFTESAIGEVPEDGAARADLDHVLESARRAKEVVEKMLTFSHDLGDAKLGPMDMRTVVAEALKLFSPFVSPQIRVKCELDEALPLVRGDTALAVQMVMNLCTNAYQAMQGGDGVLTIGLHHKGGRVELLVSDTGRGMDAATLERIFEPFFTTREIGQGTGLGLSVVHGIVESFGATIGIQSTVGVGTTFRVVFPELRPDTVAEAIQ